MENCIFCKIVAGEIPSFKVFENDTHLAFLDINPNTKGVTLVIPKKHTSSNIIKVDENVYTQTLQIAWEVSQKLAAKLNVKRVGLAIEGTGIDHLHIKLYPFYTEDNKVLQETSENVYHEFYPGYLTTQAGPQAGFDDLKKLAEDLAD